MFLFRVILMCTTIDIIHGKDITAFSFASYYTDNMILEGSPSNVVIWGYGAPGAHVNITIQSKKFAKSIYTNVTETGVWKANMGRYNSKSTTKNKMYFYNITAVEKIDKTLVKEIGIKNILFGNVWICNEEMESFNFSMGQTANRKLRDKEIRKASGFNYTRILNIGTVQSSTLKDGVYAYTYDWTSLSTDLLNNTAEGSLSRMCVLYAIELYHKLGLPIGIVHISHKDSKLEEWVPPEVTKSCGRKIRGKRKTESNLSSLWYVVIEPLLSMTIKGAIWYQGKNEFKRDTAEYQCLFSNLISSWRKKAYVESMNTTDKVFPFGFVQASGYTFDQKEDIAAVQWAQTGGYGYVPNEKMPNVFMAASYDLTEYSDKKFYRSFSVTKKAALADRLMHAALRLTNGVSRYRMYGPVGKAVVENKKNKTEVRVIYNETVQLQHRQDLFSFNCLSKSNPGWRAGVADQISSIEIKITIPQHCPFKEFAYFWNTYPCAQIRCGIHSVDKYKLPAPIYKWEFKHVLNFQHGDVLLSGSGRIAPAAFLLCITLYLMI